MATAELNGTTIWHDRLGEGTPCVVIHGGLGVDHTAYRAFDVLADRLALVYYDQRGNGRSGRPPLETITMPQLADDAVSLADHLGIDRFVAAGHSYGGFVAQELAIRHRDRLSGLVLVATTPGQLGEGEEPGAHHGPPPPPEVEEVLRSIPASDEDLAESMARLAPHYVRRADPASMAAAVAGTVFSASAMVRGFEVLAGWSSADRLAAVDVPALVVAGALDVFTSAPQSRRIAARLPGAELIEVAGAGHFVWLDAPGEVFGAIRRWLDRNGL